jgi:hypothetical protein
MNGHRQTGPVGPFGATTGRAPSCTTGNVPPLPAILPDQVAPVVRIAVGERYLCRPYPPYGPAYVPPR